MSKDQPIIVKKIKKKGHGGGHHGGAWKVAYADFVTAMMAFFMVLWLLAMLSIDSRDSIAVYFRSYSIFSGNEAPGGAGAGISVMSGGPIRIDTQEGDIQKGDSYRNLEMKLGGTLESELGGLNDQVMMVVTKDGIRIELMEKYGSSMFEAGTANLTEAGESIVWVLATALKDVKYNLAIEGHTDSSKFARENYSNWELAADRANAARRALVEGGVDEHKIKRVTSYADSSLYNVNDPYDPMNRRVSILILQQ